MKKELAAIILLLLIFGGTMYNVRYLENRIDDIEEQIGSSRESFLQGDTESAVRQLEEALDAWNSADGYTHIFIRHTDIDGTTEAFYYALGCAMSGNAGETEGAYGNLLSHLESIVNMERVSPGSIF
jgi:hypothetical protein